MNLKSSPLVSIVTPLYNTEAYLAECIESVLAQTYQNWEYVIVNNCSTDRSLEIAQQYAQKDARIRIHNNDEFLNQFQNWNHAMRQIALDSKYCKVLHADDWLFPECIARMVELAEEHPSVGIVSAYRLDETSVNLDGLPYPSTVVPGHEICRQSLLDGLSVFGSPTSLLIRSDIVRSRETFYDESTLHTDTELCYDILQDYDFGFVHQVLTFTRRHNESVTSLTHRFNTHLLAAFTVLLRYGPTYLNGDYEDRLEKMLAKYYRFLARSALDLREREFWTYHKNELEKLGYPMSVPRLIKTLFRMLLNLGDVVGRVRHALRRRKRQETSEDGQTWDTVLSSIYSRED